MSTPLSQLINLLSLEKIEEGLFRGQSWDLGLKAMFGGQVMGQALAAAQGTVDLKRSVHSFHSYFLLPGDPSKPIIYDVEVIRDGRSFCTRRVKAIQKGRPIFYLTASFHIEEAGFDHHAKMPDVPKPEELAPDFLWYEKYQDQLPLKMRQQLLYHKPIDMRSVANSNPFDPKVTEPIRHVWFKADGKLPDDPRTHKHTLAYASDYFFLITALQPHGKSMLKDPLIMATIDHAMWFHRDFKFDEWLLYSIDSPNAAGARGFVRGQFFNRLGQLVASTAQEGVIRGLKLAQT